MTNQLKVIILKNLQNSDEDFVDKIVDKTILIPTPKEIALSEEKNIGMQYRFC